MDILLFVIMGLLLGSFYNVCIYRIPKKESIAFPPSHCPKCNHKIRWWENIPVISYVLILRGKCSSCGERISIQYPLVELITGLSFGLIYYRYGMSIWTVELVIVASILIIASGIDWENYYIPDRFTLGLMILGYGFSFFNGVGIERAFIGSACYAFFFVIIYGYGERVFKKEVLGFGDVKLAAGIGSIVGYLGFYRMHIFVTASFVSGAVYGIYLMITKKKDRKSEVPFGPFIALGGFISALLFL
jgi:leader peptidase (prepilin peptidase)/N-methyltransferase